jgi:hypothetical protein
VAGAFAVGALALALTAAFSADRYPVPAPASPDALAHIAQKNRDAATVAAARQRFQAAAAAHDADRAAAQDAGGAGAVRN